ncbi:MAG: hypothetical protein FWG10_08555 [Eubacteriaceae bacterium]|nr:hypothetical protein [Eubacteriaceae bacterium]
MVKWAKISGEQCFGLFALGFAFFALQELPYIIMPFIALGSNPLLEMQDKSVLLNALEKVFGVSCVATMLFVVHKDAVWFSLDTISEKLFFTAAIAAIVVYFVGWFLYFNGCQTKGLIIASLVAQPPVYYTFIGLWRKNYPLAIIGCLFLAAHTANVAHNLSP